MWGLLLGVLGCAPGGQSGTEFAGGADWVDPTRALVFESSVGGFTMSALDAPFDGELAEIASTPVYDNAGYAALPRVFAAPSGDRAVLFLETLVDSAGPRHAVDVSAGGVVDVAPRATRIDVAWRGNDGAALVLEDYSHAVRMSPDWSVIYTDSFTNPCTSYVMAWVIEDDGTQIGWCGSAPLIVDGNDQLASAASPISDPVFAVDAVVGASGRGVFFVATSSGGGFDLHRVIHEADDSFTLETLASFDEALTGDRALVASSELAAVFSTHVANTGAWNIFAVRNDGSGWATETVGTYDTEQGIAAIGDDPQILVSRVSLELALSDPGGTYASQEVAEIGVGLPPREDTGCHLASPATRPVSGLGSIVLALLISLGITRRKSR